MDQPLIAHSIWMGFTQDQKRKLVRLFDIPRTGEVIVHVGEMMNNNIGGVAKQDGFQPQDLYAITTEKLQTLIGTEDTDFHHMVQHVIDNLDDLYYEKFPEDKPHPEVTVTEVPLFSVPEKAAEAEFVPRDPEELLKKAEPIDLGTPEVGATKGETTTIDTSKKKPYAKTKATKAK